VHLVANDKQHDKISMSFASKIVKAGVIRTRAESYRMFIEIPLSYRPSVTDYMFMKGSVNVTISEI
jgi:hypothetical protein